MAAGEASGPGGGVKVVPAAQAAAQAAKKREIVNRESMEIFRRAQAPLSSTPFSVPVEEANFPSSKPMRWSIETKRFGNG